MFRQDSRRHYRLSHTMLVAGALVGYAGAAHAQAMYTIGGFLDESVTAYRDSNGARLVQMQDSAIFPTKIFFRGADDLGGGLSANFSLDSMIGLSNGSLSPQSHGALFENSAWVGLRQSSLGSIRMGQQNDFSFDYFLIGGIDPATGIAGGMLNFRTGSFGADLLGVKGPGQIGAAITGGPYAPIITNGVPTGLGAINWDRVGGTRMSNAVKVVSDEYAGFSIGAMYSFGGVAGDFSNASGKSAVLSYRAHETHAAVVYTEQNYSAIDGGHGGIANLLAGVRTRISDFKLSAMYSQARNTYTGARIYALATGVGYDFTFDWYLGAAYTYSNGNSQLKNVTVNQAALQLTHALSKLTSIYLTGVFQRTNGAYAAEIGNTVASGNIQSVVALGMLVRF